MAGMSRTNIHLRQETVNAVESLVRKGAFASADDAVLAAIEAWRESHADGDARLHAIRAKIRRSIEDPRDDFSLEEVDEALDLMMREPVAGRATG